MDPAERAGTAPAPAHPPLRDTYDVVVIGSGLGGLTVAAFLARAGLEVLVAERLPQAGGLAHSFRRKDRYLFDAAVRYTIDESLYDFMLGALGVRDRIEFGRLDPFYSVIMPGRILHMPAGEARELDFMIRTFPQEEKGLRALHALAKVVHLEAHSLPPALSMNALDGAVKRFPTLFANIRRTLRETVDEFVTDPVASLAWTAGWPYLGAPPSILSFVTYAQFFFSGVGSALYPMGSFQSVVDAFVQGVEGNGGEILLGNGVERVLMEGAAAAGVVLKSGHVVRAATVVSNVDAITTFLDMVGATHLPAPFVKNLGRLVPTASAFSLYLATSLDVPRILGANAHELFVFGDVDDRAAWAGNMRGEPGSLFASVTTAVDPSLAPPGEHIVIATAPAPFGPRERWATEKEQWTAAMLRLLEQGIPGLGDNLTYLEDASPLSVEAYSGAHDGAFLGWELNPIQQSSRRPHQRTPVRGLYLAGQWTYPGGGAIRVAVSGLQAAMLILGDLGLHDAAAALRPPDLAPES